MKKVINKKITIYLAIFKLFFFSKMTKVDTRTLKERIRRNVGKF